ncbi:MAG: DinB family protein [Chloroflexi bacterium]|nr:MAG: DinB family protein [Chloroflexota bacterium]
MIPASRSTRRPCRCTPSSGTSPTTPPPAPFLAEEHAAAVLPARVYTRAELEAYVAHCRRKAQATAEALTEEGWRRPCRWGRGETSFAELLLVNLGHVREHTAQLGMWLGQRG